MGVMTFKTNLVPDADNTRELGSSTKGWKIYGNLTGNATNVTGTVDIAHGGTGATTAANARSNLGLSSAMLFKGSLGTGGTITSLAAASSSNQGETYKVITDGTYASQAAKAGDVFVSNGSSWILIPSGDEPSGTVTSITLKAGTGISLDTDNTAITTSGTRTIALANSGVVANTYGSTTQQTPTHDSTFNVPYFTVDATGRITTAGTSTVKLPNDTQVTQSSTTTTNWRNLILSYQNGNSATQDITTDTQPVYAAAGIAAQPSTGTIRANKYNIADAVTLQYNTSTHALDFVFA